MKIRDMGTTDFEADFAAAPTSVRGSATRSQQGHVPEAGPSGVVERSIRGSPRRSCGGLVTISERAAAVALGDSRRSRATLTSGDQLSKATPSILGAWAPLALIHNLRARSHAVAEVCGVRRVGRGEHRGGATGTTSSWTSSIRS